MNQPEPDPIENVNWIGPGGLIEIIYWPLAHPGYRITHDVTTAFKLRRLFAAAYAPETIARVTLRSSMARLDARQYIATEEVARTS
jgi:hypothetical protein